LPLVAQAQVTHRMFSPSIETIASGEALDDLSRLLGRKDILDRHV
jgi:hypothetical protein